MLQQDTLLLEARESVCHLHVTSRARESPVLYPTPGCSVASSGLFSPPFSCRSIPRWPFPGEHSLR